jgi:salicylate hydroxylase
MQMADSLQLVLQDTFDRNEEKYGYKCWFLHRVDLHEGLRSLALDPSSTPGKAATIQLESEVVRIDCEEGVFTLVNGEKVQKDLVVIADGAHVSNLLRSKS